MIREFEKLARATRRAWRAKRFSREAFPALALELLEGHAIPASFDFETLLAGLVAARRIPEQWDRRPLPFGQPPLTVHRDPDDRFLIDVYFWIGQESSIHDHGFAGAFQVLRGENLSCEYRFEVEERPHPRLHLGTLTCAATTFMKPGACQVLVARKHGYIHRVWHLERPTITLVLRTTDSPGVFSYFEGGIAASRYQPEPGSLQQRRLQAVEFLGEVGSAAAPSLMEEVLARSEPPALVQAVLSYPGYADPARLEAALRKLGRARGSWVMRLLEARRAIERVASVDMNAIDDVGARVLLAALLSLETRPAIRKVIRRRYPGRPPETMLSRWLDEIAAARRDGVPFDPLDASVARHLFGGKSDAEVAAALARDPPAAILERCRRLRSDRLFRPLFRSDA